MAAARSVRRRRSAESANSRNTALRDVPRRVASASTSLRRSSGIDTITLAMPAVYRGIRLKRKLHLIRRGRPPVRPTTLGLRADKFRP
jgi:CRP-like cAMP-binding protein